MTYLNKEHTRRRFNRISLDGQVSLDFSTRNYDICKVQDISLTGLFVKGSFQQKIGEHCVVKIFPKMMGIYSRFLAAAKIVRKNETGIGIEFISMSDNDYMFLQATLLCEAEDPILVACEFPDESSFEIDRLKNN